MRKTPIGKAVGRNVVWHNFFYCSRSYYALGQIYRDFHVTENRECSMAVVANRSFPILCLRLDIVEIFHPPYSPLVSAIVTWVFRNRQGKCYEIVTFDFGYPYVHPVLRSLN